MLTRFINFCSTTMYANIDIIQTNTANKTKHKYEEVAKQKSITSLFRNIKKYKMKEKCQR